MKMIRTTCFPLLLTSLLWFAPVVSPVARQGVDHRSDGRRLSALPPTGRILPEAHYAAIRAYNYHSLVYTFSDAPPSTNPSGGIREDIPDQYRAKYQKWKTEFLSTETGRRQWEMYAQNPQFTLTIAVSSDNRHGASTGKYKWSDADGLVGATIVLGSEIDEEFPGPVYYPVMNSLGWSEELYTAGKDILAATKIAHEFGHVLQASHADARLYQLQNKLMPNYRTIFLTNGHDVHDPRLTEMARQMGGTCVEVWEDREYWGEANAMLYLRDRVLEKGFRCYLFARIRRTVEEYAKNYAERFKRVAQSEPDLCGWQ